MLAHGLTVFIAAFLVFQVQPLLGKYLLPWFGGGPAVWTSCLLFFQVLLLAGYAYAHLLTRYFTLRAQALIQLLLAFIAVAFLPIIPAHPLKNQHENPLSTIPLVLARSVGIAYFVLAATGPLIQAWSRMRLTSPYRLYALSNFGSLLGLLTYPLFFEVHFSRAKQARIWEWGLVLYGAGCAWCALQLWLAPKPANSLAFVPSAEPRAPGSLSERKVPPAGLWRRLQWWLWPACASVLLLAVTNKLCLDVAAVPLLWVLPLAVYLLSFVVCFDNPKWYRRLPCTVALTLSMAGLCWALFKGSGWPFWIQGAVYIGGLLICCLVCHGELYRLRPGPEALTGFYLLVALGGATGGLFVSLVAPIIFTNYYELHWGLGVCGLLVALCWTVETLGFVSCRAENPGKPVPHALGRVGRDWRGLGLAFIWIGFFAVATTLWLQARRPGTAIVHKSRNFYGALTVYEHRQDEPNGHHFLLQHGRITHGLQFAAPSLQALPTTYYGPQSGVGLAFKALPAGARRVGAVGLGTGTLAAYSRAGDSLRFYEINPAVQNLARSRFTYLSKCRGDCTVTLGDARLSLEAEPAQGFDLLALDAFSSDSIPIHLLTREAFELYLRHLKPGGIIAVHTSNHFLDLEPVVLGLAGHFGLAYALVDQDPKRDEWWIYASSWILLCRDPQVLSHPAISSAARPPANRSRTLRLWTDDFSNLLQILK